MKAGVFGLSLHGETALDEIGFFIPLLLRPAPSERNKSLWAFRPKRRFGESPRYPPPAAGRGCPPPVPSGAVPDRLRPPCRPFP